MRHLLRPATARVNCVNFKIVLSIKNWYLSLILANKVVQSVRGHLAIHHSCPCRCMRFGLVVESSSEIHLDVCIKAWMIACDRACFSPIGVRSLAPVNHCCCAGSANWLRLSAHCAHSIACMHTSVCSTRQKMKQKPFCSVARKIKNKKNL